MPLPKCGFLVLRTTCGDDCYEAWLPPQSCLPLLARMNGRRRTKEGRTSHRWAPGQIGSGPPGVSRKFDVLQARLIACIASTSRPRARYNAQRASPFGTADQSCSGSKVRRFQRRSELGIFCVEALVAMRPKADLICSLGA